MLINVIFPKNKTNNKLSAFRNISENVSSSYCQTLCGNSPKIFQWGLQHCLKNLLRHQNVLVGPKCFQKYQWKYQFLLTPSPLQANSNPHSPTLFLSLGRSFALRPLPSPLRQNIFQNSPTHHPPLNTSVTALVCIISLILKRS